MSFPKRNLIACAVSAAAMLATGCSSSNNGESRVFFDATGVTATAANSIITQTYKNLNTAAANLLVAVQALADGDATEAELNTAQEAWRAARVPWESSEGFLFGPVASLGVDPAIDSWPLNTPDLKEFLANNPNASKADIENAGDDLRGFHALEWLLFGLDDDGAINSDMAVADLKNQTGAINYLVALASAFTDQTQQLEDSWTTDFNGNGAYADDVANPGAGQLFASQAGVLEELINGMIGIVDEVSSAKIADPLGVSIADADTSQVESQYSWNSLTDFYNDMQSVLNLYSGTLGFSPSTNAISTADNGIYAFVSAHNTELADRVLQEIITSQEKIALIKGDGDASTPVISGAALPFREQIKTESGRALINDAIDALLVTLTSLEGEVLPLVTATDFAR